jgi:hypothetical protein
MRGRHIRDTVMCMMSVRVQLINQLVPVRLSAGLWTPRRSCDAAGRELNPNGEGTAALAWSTKRAGRITSRCPVCPAVRCGTMRREGRVRPGIHHIVSRARGFASRTNDQPAGRRRRAAGRTPCRRRARAPAVRRATHASRPSLSPWPWPPAPGKRNMYLLLAAGTRNPGCSGRALLCRARDVSEAPLQECLCFPL